MNGRKPKKLVDNNSKQPDEFKPLVWLNVTLTSEDEAAILADENGLEFHASALIGLVCNGYGCTVKYNSERKSYNCSLYRPYNADGSGGCGISSFAPDVRLALCVTLYKFDVHFGSFLPDAAGLDTSHQQRRSFG